MVGAGRVGPERGARAGMPWRGGAASDAPLPAVLCAGARRARRRMPNKVCGRDAKQVLNKYQTQVRNTSVGRF